MNELSVVRAAGKHLVEKTLVAARVDRLGQRLRPGRGLVLAYHNVVPDSAPPLGDRSLHLPVSAFARQLDLLCQLGRVVSLDDLMSAGDTHDQMMRFALTFDDAYRGAVTSGVRELEQRGLPATIFVAPGLIGDHTFWWDALYRAEDSGGPDLRERILAEGKGLDPEAMRMAHEAGLRVASMPDYCRSATEAELFAAAAAKGITVGSHTWRHAALVSLEGDALQDEVTRPRAWLQERFGSGYVDVLAYPFGLHSAPVREATRGAGYRAGLALKPASVRVAHAPQSTADAFSLPRLNVPAGLSLSGLRLRAAWL